MIVHDVIQGEHEWLDLRAGIPTTSQFSRILTPATRKLSGQAEKYLMECLAERKLGHALDWGGTNWTERGQILEREAIPHYELMTDHEVTRVGFVTLDDGSAGCSPDGLADSDGMVEVKCRSLPIHLAYLLTSGLPADMTQVQGGLWLCEREWCDVYGYCPGQPKIRIRVYRDEDYIRDLKKAVRQFTDALDTAEAQLDELGPGGRWEVWLSGASLTDEELEAVEVETRAAVDDGRLEPEGRDEIVQLCVTGDWREVRARMVELRREAVPA